MIWATVSSQSYFCWLYRASPFLAPNNITNLILVLTIWWCVDVFMCRVFSCVVGRGCFLWPERSLGKILIKILPCTPWPNLPVTPGISWLPTFAFQSPIMKRTSFVCVLKGLVGLHRTIQLQLLQHYCLGHRLGLPWYWMVCLGNSQRSLLLNIMGLLKSIP